jgi:hypothetical protein
MNATRTSAVHRLRLATLVLALPLIGSTVLAKGVTLDADCAPQLDSLQQRLYLLANQSTDELRRFVWTRRGIYQLNVMDISEWAESVNAARSACRKSVASAERS